MFSANLLYYVGGRCHELQPTSRSVDVKLVGSKGEGKSVLHFDLSQKEYKEVLLYVPSYSKYQSAVYCCRVTDVALTCSRHEKCEERTEMVFKDRESLKGKIIQKHRTFSKMKSHFKQLVCSKTTSYQVYTSSEDCVLRVQEIPPSSMLTIDINFLLELKPAFDGTAGCVPVCCSWSKKTAFCYSLEYISSYPLGTVNIWDKTSAPVVKWRIHGAEKNFASLFSNSEQGSPGKLEFTIDNVPNSSPLLLVTSSERCNGSQGREHHVILDHLYISEHDRRVAHIRFPSEFIFLVDCSGSMCGASIQSAADALMLFLKSLPTSCYFNVIAFGSTYRNLFENSQKYCKETVERAMAFAHKLQASLGGTELLNPLHWILKKPLVADMPRQIFILTDGAVTNTKAVLREIQKYSHQIRCHTFGIGSEACQELVLGVATLSNGRHALVSTTDRLQEKVIEALEESLKPALTDVGITWRPPRNYDIVETVSGHCGAVFNSGHVSYWGRVVDNGSDKDGTDDNEASATISATLGSMHKFEQTICNISEVEKSSIPGVHSITERLLGWSKIQEFERSFSISRRRSQDEHSLIEDAADKSRQTSCVSQQLTQLSGQHHIPCCLNYLSSEDSSFLSVSQVIPEVYSQHKPLQASSRPLHHSRHKHYYRQRNGSSKYHMSDTPSFLPTPNSLGTMFKGAVSSVSNSLRTLISDGLDLLFGGYPDLVEDGQRIEDEIDTQGSTKMLQWGPEGQLIHPSIYFQHSGESGGSCNGNMNCDTVRKRKLDHVPSVAKSLKLDDSLTEDPLPSSGMACMSLTDRSSQDDTQDYSSCQMDITQRSITGPAAMMPLISMQAFDGAWHLSEAFSAAIGIPHKQVEDFIHSQANCSSIPNCNRNGELPSNHEPFWATALGVACLQFHFVMYKTEWKLLVEKAIGWLDDINLTTSDHAVECSRDFIKQISIA